MARIDLRSQVQNILPRVFGGTDNEYGAASKWLLIYKQNDSGSSLAVGTLVQLTVGLQPTQTAGGTVSGVIVGRIGTSGKLEEVACAADNNCAIATAGMVTMTTTGTATTGYYVSASSTPGAALVGASVVAGTFGQVIHPISASKAAVLLGDGVVPTPTGAPSYATPAIVLGSSAAAGAAATVIRSDSTIVAFDATSPTTIAFGDSAAVGTAAFATRRDHKHGIPAIFDTTDPTTIAFGDVADDGAATVAAKRDHRHGAPSNPVTHGDILIDDTHSTPLIFGDLLQNDDQDDLLYADL